MKVSGFQRCRPNTDTEPQSFAVLEREILIGMRLLGVNKISDLKPELVECLPR